MERLCSKCPPVQRAGRHKDTKNRTNENNGALFLSSKTCDVVHIKSDCSCVKKDKIELQCKVEIPQLQLSWEHVSGHVSLSNTFYCIWSNQGFILKHLHKIIIRGSVTSPIITYEHQGFFKNSAGNRAACRVIVGLEPIPADMESPVHHKADNKIISKLKLNLCPSKNK